MKAAKLSNRIQNPTVRKLAKKLATRLSRRNGKLMLDDAPTISTRGWVS